MGSYSLTAKATDNAGVATTSAAVNITVNGAPANVPPTVSITSPAGGATFTAPATITINANASDSDGTISKVEFFRDGVLLGQSTIAPYSFTWTNVAAGNYSLTATATDNVGATATSTAVSVTVNAPPNAPPTVSITSPASGATFTAPANITINASASDSDGGIAKVEFFRDGLLLGQSTTAPYSFTWSSVAAGSYSLTAKATDNLGATTTSTMVSVTVNTSGNQPPTVTITTPTNGATFTAPASFTIKATASDSDGSITKVEFFRNGILLGQDTTASYSFAWSGVAAGSYALTAKATDNSGATTTSTAVNVTVNSAGNALPTVSITSPAAGATFDAPATITINATAADSDGSITKVEFFKDGLLLGEDTAAPYSLTWSNVPAGTYSLTARATDNLGATTTSTAVSVTVNDLAPPPPPPPPPPPSSDNFSTARVDPINRTGQPGEDLLSRNFNWGLPLLGLAGRAGLDLGLSLTYNSLVWTRDGSSIKYNADNGFPGPGFRLGFPAIQSRYFNSQIGVNAYLLISPAGGRTELRQVGSSNVYEAANSSYLQLIDNGTLLLRGADGTQLTYALIGNEYRCTQVKDPNGNFISVAYDGGGRISTISDTLARTVTFNYDVFQNLVSITQTWNGQTHEWATFGYSNLTIQTNFPTLTVVGPANGTIIPVLTQVGLDDGSRINFDYTSWGQIYKVTQTAADGHQLSYTSYNLPLDAVSAQSDCPRFTERRDWAENWNSGVEVTTFYAFDTSGGWGQITAPDGTIYKEFFFTTGWQRGLTSQTEIWSSGVRKKWTTIDWTQDNTTVAYRLNPRVTETNVYDDSGNRRRSSVSYGSFGLPTDAYEYSADGVSVLRRVHTDYNLSPTYVDRRIIGLPSAQYLYDGAGVLFSKVDYQYDLGGEFLQYQGTPAQHDAAGFSAAFVQGRGNLCVVRRWNVNDPNNSALAVENRIGYNTVGGAIFSRDPLGHQSTVSYADLFSDFLDRGTLAYATTVTDADGFSSTVQYHYDMGVVTRTQDPKGAVATKTYDGAGRLDRVTNVTSGSYTRYVYPNSQTEVQSFSLLQTGPEEAYSVQLLDGAGRVRATARDFPLGVDAHYSASFAIYDRMGRIVQQSNPTEITANWLPTGEDTEWWWSFQDYDWRGRPTVSTNTDGTTRTAAYGGCGCAGGEVVTLTDEVGRRQRVSYDVLGRVAKTEVLNPDSSIYSTTTNTYNIRDQIVRVFQQQGVGGAGQETTMSYDGHGRQATRKMPIESSPCSYAYNADDTLQSRTDPRGVTTTYSYNARHLLTGISYSPPAGIPATAPVGFGYDGVGNRLWMTDGTGRIDYQYDTLSRLTSETRQFTGLFGSFALTYGYNIGGLVTSVTDQFGASVGYTYDKIGQLGAITGSGFAAVSTYATGIQYRASGALKHFTAGSGVNISLSYNERLQVTSYSLQGAVSGGTGDPWSIGSNYEYNSD
ncbi:MAG TPA: Ig-like domain-containing protein, partial [Blastocatellia bacterium]|nr:Ig-like domain-containing protein [Blastocatellia bacterium]